MKKIIENGRVIVGLTCMFAGLTCMSYATLATISDAYDKWIQRKETK